MAAPPADDRFWRETEPAKLGVARRTGPAEDFGATGWRAWILEVERTWLGLSRAPLVERLRDAGWAADEPDAYCPRCGTTCGSFEVGPRGCPACETRSLRWDRAVRLGSYEGVLRELVHDVKFSGWKTLGRELGRLLGAATVRALEEAAVPIGEVGVVPVPTTLWRRMSRGIDHTGILARGVGEVLGAPVLPALGRSHRPAQVGASASRRRENVRRSMRVTSVRSLAGRVIVVVDDVRTTGATLEECCRAFAGLPAEFRPRSVWVATLGVTPESGLGPRALAGNPDKVRSSRGGLSGETKGRA